MRAQLLTLFTILATFTYAQDFNISWQQCYGGSGDDARDDITKIEPVDDGYVILSKTESDDGDVLNFHGGQDLWIFKIDFDGNVIWSRCLGGSFDEYPYQLMVDADGGFFVAGCTSSDDGDVSGNNGGHGLSMDFWLVKVSSNGEVEWQKCYGGTYDEWMYNAVQLSNGNIVMMGESNSSDGDLTNNYGYLDGWIMEVNSQGDLLWQENLGGSLQDGIYGATETSDYGLLICGATSSSDNTVECYNSSYNAWVLKLDKDRDIEWQKCYGGSHSEYFTRVIQVSNGYLISGTSDSNDGDVSGHHGAVGDHQPDVWVVKTDFQGNIIWQKSLGGSYNEGVEKIIPSVNGYLLLCNSASNNGDVSGNNSYGSPYRDIWLVKLDFEGELMWQKCIGGYLDQRAQDAILTDDNKLILSGSTRVPYPEDDVICDYYSGQNLADVWILEMDYYDDININRKPDGKIEVFPNPASDYVYFKYEFSDQYSNRELVVRDIHGKLVFSQKLSEQKGTLTWFPEKINAGIYFYSVIGKKDVISGKVMVID